jgi:hypothetical protein
MTVHRGEQKSPGYAEIAHGGEQWQVMAHREEQKYPSYAEIGQRGEQKSSD